MFSMVCQYFGH